MSNHPFRKKFEITFFHIFEKLEISHFLFSYINKVSNSKFICLNWFHYRFLEFFKDEGVYFSISFNIGLVFIR